MNYRLCHSALLIAALVTACASPERRDEVQGDEKAARINVQLGATYLEQGDLELANVKLERALDQDPKLATAHWTYALLQLRLGRPKLAEKHFREAIDLDPEDSRAHTAYGAFLCNTGRLQEAEKQFEQALENPLYDQPETALTNAGVCALKAQDTAKAEDYFRQALDKNSEFAPALSEMARLSFEQQRYVQTRAYLERYREAVGHNAASLWLAVQTETRLGDRDAAGSYALQLKHKYPESREAAQLLDMQRDGS
jgi:type IV pilus assembly protein PilF